MHYNKKDIFKLETVFKNIATKNGLKWLAAKNFIFRILMLGVFCYAMKLSFNVALAWETANVADLILGPMIALPLLWIPFNKGVKAFIAEAKADADNNTK